MLGCLSLAWVFSLLYDPTTPWNKLWSPKDKTKEKKLWNQKETVLWWSVFEIMGIANSPMVWLICSWVSWYFRFFGVEVTLAIWKQPLPSDSLHQEHNNTFPSNTENILVGLMDQDSWGIKLTSTLRYLMSPGGKESTLFMEMHFLWSQNLFFKGMFFPDLEEFLLGHKHFIV